MQQLLLKWGIPSYVTSIITTVPTVQQLQIPIAKTIPQQIGYIYGMAQLCDTASPDNNTLITQADSANVYMVLKDGPTEFFQRVRLDQMVYTTPGFPNLNPESYMRVNIPGNFDLSTSYYENPTGIVSTTGEEAVTYVIMLQLWFISTESYKWLMKKGYIDGEYADQFINSKR